MKRTLIFLILGLLSIATLDSVDAKKGKSAKKKGKSALAKKSGFTECMAKSGGLGKGEDPDPRILLIMQKTAKTIVNLKCQDPAAPESCRRVTLEPQLQKSEVLGGIGINWFVKVKASDDWTAYIKVFEQDSKEGNAVVVTGFLEGNANSDEIPYIP